MKITILLKARLKSNLLARAYINELKARKQLWALPVAAAGILTALVFFSIMLIQNYSVFLKIGTETGEPELVILISAVFSSVIIFFIGTPLCLSNIYYSKDTPLVAMLPVSTTSIIMSRALSVYLFILPVHLLITIPAAALYISAAGGIEALISLVVFSIAGPALPLLAGLAAAAILAAAGNLSGHRTAVETAGMLTAIILAGALQLAFSRSVISGGDLTGFADIISGYTEILKRIFFASAWTAAGYTAGGWKYLLAGFGFSAAAVTTAVLILNRMKLNPAPHEREKLRRTIGRTAAGILPESSASPTAALIRREWTIVKSSSSFLMETIAEAVILPILLIFFYFTIPDDFISIARDFASSLKALPLTVFGMLVLFGSITSVSSTSISREGRRFDISKSIPVPGSIQVRAKLYFHLILFLSAWYLNLTIMMIILKLPPATLLYLIPAGPAVVVLEFISVIHIDLSRPVLNWTHPQQAMKQNMNVPVGMGFGMLVITGLALPAAGLFIAGLNTTVIGIIITAEAALADFILLPKILKYSDRRYIEISH